MADESRVVSSLKKVAEHYGVRVDTIRKRWRPNGMPGNRGAWDLDAIDGWRQTRRQEKDRSGTLTVDGKVADSTPDVQGKMLDSLGQAKAKGIIADARKKDADARIKEIQALKAENVGLVDLDVVEEFNSGWLADARNIIKAVPAGWLSLLATI